MRESLWARFQAASTVINKRYVQFFEEQKEKELVNLQEKTALCEAVERIDCTLLKSAKDWEKKANEVFEIQKKWKTIGLTPKKHNTKIFERFRAACNREREDETACFIDLPRRFYTRSICCVVA